MAGKERVKVSERVKSRLPDFPKFTITYSMSENEEESIGYQDHMKQVMEDYNQEFGTHFRLADLRGFNTDEMCIRDSLYSIKMMGDGLQQAAGDRLRYFIDKYTSNPILGILVGIGMTALIQSSSGVTVITVGMVSAGLLTLRQAIGIVMGANIGTTVTSFIIGFKLGEYALPILFVGAVCIFFTKNRAINNIGRILFGVGGIFFALNLMSGAMEPLKDLQEMCIRDSYWYSQYSYLCQVAKYYENNDLENVNREIYALRNFRAKYRKES